MTDPVSKQLLKSDSLCLIPWAHLHTWPNGAVYHCCISSMNDKVGSLKENKLSEIWNNDAMKELRLDMINGKRPRLCHKCHEQEDVGFISMRHRFNKSYSKYRHLIDETNADGSVDKMNLLYWDFRFSNICNFKCRSCGPQLSSSWYEDSKKIWGQLPDDLPDDKLIRKNMWAEIEEQLVTADIQEIYFAGGEPLIMDEHYRILQRLDELGKHDILIRYNTNFSQLQYKKLNVLDIWPRFRKVEIGASLDAMGARAEYVRHGTDWSVILENIKQLKARAPEVEFKINCTIGATNIWHVPDFFRWCVDNKVVKHRHDFHPSLIQDPMHLRSQILPKKFKNKITKKYKKLIDEINSNEPAGHEWIGEKWQSVVDYMNAEDRTDMLPEFKMITDKLDKIRGESFVDTFPELKGLLDNVK